MAVMIHLNSGSRQFTGSQIAASSTNFTQTMANSSDVTDETHALIDAILQALPVLNLENAVEGLPLAQHSTSS
jgi:hypothetical protein